MQSIAVECIAIGSYCIIYNTTPMQPGPCRNVIVTVLFQDLTSYALDLCWTKTNTRTYTCGWLSQHIFISISVTHAHFFVDFDDDNTHTCRYRFILYLLINVLSLVLLPLRSVYLECHTASLQSQQRWHHCQAQLDFLQSCSIFLERKSAHGLPGPTI